MQKSEQKLNSAASRKPSDGRLQMVAALLISCALSVSGSACGGSESEDGDEGTPVNVDSGITAENVPEGFVFIPAGELKLTHSTSEYKSGRTLKFNAFALGKTPVTVEQYKKCVDAGVCSAVVSSGECLAGNYDRTIPRPNHPMNCVDAAGAQKYCGWIGGRLPMEEEWEYAAMHNGIEALNTKYPWGDVKPAHCEKANYAVLGERDSYYTIPVLGCDEEKNETEVFSGTSEVGLYSPAGDSPLGLVDMIGNVWEWTSSKKDSDSFILKGCSFESVDGEEVDCSIAAREDEDADDSESEIGFRCAM